MRAHQRAHPSVYRLDMRLGEKSIRRVQMRQCVKLGQGQLTLKRQPGADGCVLDRQTHIAKRCHLQSQRQPHCHSDQAARCHHK